ncbi:MAG: bifunctional 5,10-methylenetetrahydrofolate dehydrogenase/5,10-methenyltetrahydrofolate cyclohydrolase [Candidatus Melainabacteria bacterium]|nr:bifunctional 5,10-methylenetetrahydrofolate dehydrogenase/5,10-methenyltetrahydrofolate cyclohydrolase [Candidatus Melainabacteria bacterium]
MKPASIARITCTARSRGILSALNKHEGKLLVGSRVARRINASTWRRMTELNHRIDYVPELAVVHVGDNPDDRIYRIEIDRQAKRIGMPVSVFGLSQTAGKGALRDLIRCLNDRKEVAGILIQTIRDRELRRAAHACLSPEKDAEGVSAVATMELLYGEGNVMPCTPSAIRLLIKEAAGDNLSGKTVAIVNSSPVIGLPLSQLLAYDGATVTLCNRQTVDLSRHTREKDILVAAVGAPGVITREHVGRGQIVIDAAIIRDDAGSVRGCVATEQLIDKVSLITPVPGGVGPVTTSILLDNTAKLCLKSL